MSTSSLGAAEVGDDRLGVAPRRGRRRPVRHQHAQQLVGADRLGDEVRHERRVDPAGQPEHRPLEAGLAQLAADELGDDPARDVGVDGELVGQLEQRRRACRRRRPSAVIGASRRSAGDRARRRAPARRRRRRSLSWARPARSAMIRSQLAQPRAPGRSSRSSGSAIRSRRTSARSTSTTNRPSSKSGALKTGRAGRRR